MSSTPCPAEAQSIDAAGVLTSAQIADFRQHGFVSIPKISDSAEVSVLLALFERLFRERAGRREGAYYDMLSHDDDDTVTSLPTIINPIDYTPELRRLRYRANALAAARQLLGPKAVPSFEQAILKPPRHGGATPWHQDEAYRFDPNFEYRQISVWMPLQEANRDNGCMQYIPQSRGLDVLQHRSVNGDPRIHSIECVGAFDPAAAVVCPLPAGGATLHDGRTLHYSAANLTDTARYAYILSFEVPPTPTRKSRSFSWNAEKRTASLERRHSWRRRGGVAIEIWRKFRRGVWKHPGQVAFEVRRALRALWRLRRAKD